LASAASVIANPTTSMTVVSLVRISDKLRCNFPPGLSGIKNGAPISQIIVTAGLAEVAAGAIAKVAKEFARRARRCSSAHCNSYLVIAEDIAGADDHRNGPINGFGLRFTGRKRALFTGARFLMTVNCFGLA
jgi:hypothetical protein